MKVHVHRFATGDRVLVRDEGLSGTFRKMIGKDFALVQIIELTGSTGRPPSQEYAFDVHQLIDLDLAMSESFHPVRQALRKANVDPYLMKRLTIVFHKYPTTNGIRTVGNGCPPIPAGEYHIDIPAWTCVSLHDANHISLYRTIRFLNHLNLSLPSSHPSTIKERT